MQTSYSTNLNVKSSTKVVRTRENQTSRNAANSLMRIPILKRRHTTLMIGGGCAAEIYLRRLYSFCLKQGIAPEKFRRLSKKQIESATQNYIQCTRCASQKH